MKVSLSYDVSLAKLIPVPGTFFTFVPPKRYGLDFDGPPNGNLGIIPHQELGKNSKNADTKFLSDLTAIGWDWRAEHLRQHTYNGLLVFTTRPQQRINEVEKKIVDSGYVVKRIVLTDSEFDNLVMPKLTDTEIKRLYLRSRFLWKNHSEKMTESEKEELKVIGALLKDEKQLNSDQRAWLDSRFSLFRVPLNATSQA